MTPHTRLQQFYDKAYEWAISHGPSVLIGLIILFLGLRFIKIIKARLRARMSRQEIHSSLQPFILSLCITGMHILLVIAVMGIMGIGVSFFSTIVGALTVAAGLALSGTFQNFAGGILILLLKPFELDDNIQAQGQEGKVTSIQIFYTVLLTADNKTVIIPNGKLFNEVIVNVTREGKRRLDFEIKIGYAADPARVKAIIEAAVKNTKTITTNTPSNIGIVAMEVDGVKYIVNVWVAPKDFLRTKIDLHETIFKNLLAEGIKLPGM